VQLLHVLDEVIQPGTIPTQTCVLTHVTNTMQAIEGAPVDLVFQSIGGTQATNTSFGINLALLDEAHAGPGPGARHAGHNVMYFETGQGSALSANAHHGVDQQTCEARAYAVARRYKPLLVNTVVGFIGPEYLYDGKQIIRAGLEDHFCGKLLGLPMGCDICYTNHAEADQNDMDNLLVLLGAAGVNFIMGVPGADDVMLNYQSTSFHDALFVRKLLGLKRAPELTVVAAARHHRGRWCVAARPTHPAPAGHAGPTAPLASQLKWQHSHDQPTRAPCPPVRRHRHPIPPAPPKRLAPRPRSHSRHRLPTRGPRCASTPTPALPWGGWAPVCPWQRCCNLALPTPWRAMPFTPRWTLTR
jgi:hypothetical protein